MLSIPRTNNQDGAGTDASHPPRQSEGKLSQVKGVQSGGDYLSARGVTRVGHEAPHFRHRQCGVTFSPSNT